MRLLFCLITTFGFVFGNQNDAGGSPSRGVSCQRNSFFRHWNVTIQRQVIQSGFHRELSINVSIAGDSTNDCHLLIKEELPRDAFVDPYQVDQLKERDAGYQIFVPLDVNLEAMAQDSNPQTVYIFIDTSSFVAHNKSSIIVPFHFRYQSAAFSEQSGKYAEVYWINPTVLSRCTDQKLPSNCSHHTTTELCGPDNHPNCLWIENQEIEQPKMFGFEEFCNPPKEMDVPRGDLNDLPLVAIITSVVVLTGCSYLINSIMQPTKQKLNSA